jgi:hypothetical protein
MNPLERYMQQLDQLDGREVTVTQASATVRADATAIAEEVVRVLNTPGGPTLAARAVRSALQR